LDETALQEQFAPVVMSVDAVAPAPDNVALDVGFSEYVQGAAACETVYVFPPALIDPDLEPPAFESMK
jgi:hypothetical protein